MSAGRDAPTDSTSNRSGLEQRWRGSSNKSNRLPMFAMFLAFFGRAWHLTSGNLTYLWEIINPFIDDLLPRMVIFDSCVKLPKGKMCKHGCYLQFYAYHRVWGYAQEGMDTG
jgi:hypothetical protein